MDSSLMRRNNALRSFTVAAWLGWQIESNWADPFLFAIYSIARPVASVMILVVMYSVITNGALDQPIFAYVYLGNALYILVGQVITGVSWVVIDDREHYRVAKQLFTMPMNHALYLLGRGVARLLIGTISLIIVVGFGMIVYKIPISAATIDWPVFLASMALGITTLAALGLILGALTMMMARHFWVLGEAVAGALYLFCGAIFPLETLPAWLRVVGFAFPVTYWLEVTRRALLGPDAVGFPTLVWLSDKQLLLILVGSALLMVIGSMSFYRWAVYRAKDKGILDMETSY
ncbi:MAG: ABC transporter permease [Anaerolineae bacterium]|nr:ABC transporter permease [Anaerolineae bacterium]